VNPDPSRDARASGRRQQTATVTVRFFKTQCQMESNVVVAGVINSGVVTARK